MSANVPYSKTEPRTDRPDAIAPQMSWPTRQPLALANDFIVSARAWQPSSGIAL